MSALHKVYPLISRITAAQCKTYFRGLILMSKRKSFPPQKEFQLYVQYNYVNLKFSIAMKATFTIKTWIVHFSSKCKWKIVWNKTTRVHKFCLKTEQVSLFLFISFSSDVNFYFVVGNEIFYSNVKSDQIKQQ